VKFKLFRNHSLGSDWSLKHVKCAEAVGREAAIANKTPLIHIPGLPEVEWGTGGFVYENVSNLLLEGAGRGV
jgi:hypothetical protein